MMTDESSYHSLQFDRGHRPHVTRASLHEAATTRVRDSLRNQTTIQVTCCEQPERQQGALAGTDALAARHITSQGTLRCSY